MFWSNYSGDSGDTCNFSKKLMLYRIIQLSIFGEKKTEFCRKNL